MKIISERKVKVKPLKVKKIRKRAGKTIVYEYGMVETTIPKEYVGKYVKVIICEVDS